jgi:deazaflavin-dependent oxidoreductase (nitroreductase family)
MPANPDPNQYLYLTTRGRTTGQPREIEIWYTQRGELFYIIAEYQTSNWVRNVQACADVQVRVAGSNFAGAARILSAEKEPELHAAVQELSRQKYGWGDGLVVEIRPAPKS